MGRAMKIQPKQHSIKLTAFEALGPMGIVAAETIRALQISIADIRKKNEHLSAELAKSERAVRDQALLVERLRRELAEARSQN